MNTDVVSQLEMERDEEKDFGKSNGNWGMGNIKSNNYKNTAIELHILIKSAMRERERGGGWVGVGWEECKNVDAG